jgi:hypothetical protein
MTSYIERKDDGWASSEKELSIGFLLILDLSTDNTNVPSANYPATESDRRFKQGPDRRRVRQAGQFGAIQEIADDGGHTQLPLSQAQKFSVFDRHAALGNA